MMRWTPRTTTSVVAVICGIVLVSGCAVTSTSGPTSGSPSGGSPSGGTPSGGSPSAGAPATKTVPVDAAQAERIKRIMVPLIQAMNHPRSLDKVKLAVTSDQEINAASAGGGEFYVTAGLLQKANDKQLMAVLAHEVAHDDPGHVAKARGPGAVIWHRAIILDQMFRAPARSQPLSRALSSHAPTAGRKSTKPTSTASSY